MILDLDVIFVPVGPDATPDTFEAFLDVVMDELHKIGRDDFDYSATLAKFTATFTVYDLDDEAPDMNRFWSDLRTALHAAGAATPGWAPHEPQWRVRDKHLASA